MRFPNRGGYSANRGQSSNRSDGRREFNRPAMHDAICAKCGASCQVPFVPNGRKEIYCSQCFESIRGVEPRRPKFNDRNESRTVRSPFVPNNLPPRPSNSVALAEINVKLDKLLQLLTPTEAKEVVEKTAVKKVKTPKKKAVVL